MKIKLSESAILKALEDTKLDFDIKVFYAMLDKLPSDYYKQIIVEEFFQHLCGIPFYEVYDVITGMKLYSFSKNGLLAMCQERKIAGSYLIESAISTKNMVKRRYYIRKFSSSDEYVAPDIVGRNTAGILDGGIDGTESVDDT